MVFAFIVFGIIMLGSIVMTISQSIESKQYKMIFLPFFGVFLISVELMGLIISILGIIKCLE